MTQRKINSYLNGNSGRGFSTSSNPCEPTLSYSTSTKKAMHWNAHMYKTSNQKLQFYRCKRKEQRAKKMNEHISAYNGGSELSTPDDSQNFMGNSQSQSESQDSTGWSSKLCSYNQYFPGRPTSWNNSSVLYANDVKPHVEFAAKPDFRQFSEESERLAKEKEEKEMLHNFLMSAKMCCEEANEISSKVKDKLDQQNANFITKLQQFLDKDVPDVLKKLCDINHEKIASLETILQETQDKLNTMTNQIADQMQANEKKCDESIKDVLTAVKESSETNKEFLQSYMVNILSDIKDSVCKPKPVLAEVSTQYSPNRNNSHVQTMTPDDQRNHGRHANILPFTSFQRGLHHQSPVARVSPLNTIDNVVRPKRRSQRNQHTDAKSSHAQEEIARYAVVHSLSAKPVVFSAPLPYGGSRKRLDTYCDIQQSASFNDEEFSACKENENMVFPASSPKILSETNKRRKQRRNVGRKKRNGNTRKTSDLKTGTSGMQVVSAIAVSNVNGVCTEQHLVQDEVASPDSSQDWFDGTTNISALSQDWFTEIKALQESDDDYYIFAVEDDETEIRLN